MQLPQGVLKRQKNERGQNNEGFCEKQRPGEKRRIRGVGGICQLFIRTTHAPLRNCLDPSQRGANHLRRMHRSIPSPHLQTALRLNGMILPLSG